ncbi:MAG: hypothetical protein AB9835_13490 [Eubacteriales bacterium]
MKLRLFASMLVVIMALTTAVGAVYAINTTSNTYGNTFSSDVIKLKISKLDFNGTYSEAGIIINEEDICPGYENTYTYEIKNEGTSNGYLNINEINVQNFENQVIDPEEKLGDDDKTGELGGLLKIKLFYLSDNIKTSIYDGTFNDFNNSGLMIKDFLLLSKNDTNFCIYVYWPIIYTNYQDNQAQSDKVKLSFTITLEGKDNTTTTVPTATEEPRTEEHSTNINPTSDDPKKEDSTNIEQTTTETPTTTEDYTEIPTTTQPSTQPTTQTTKQPTIDVMEPEDETEVLDEIQVPLAELTKESEVDVANTAVLPVTGGVTDIMAIIIGLLMITVGLIVKKAVKK